MASKKSRISFAVALLPKLVKQESVPKPVLEKKKFTDEENKPFLHILWIYGRV